MPEAKPKRKPAQPRKKTFEARADSALDRVQLFPAGTQDIESKPAGQPQDAPAVVSKLIDFIKKM